MVTVPFLVVLANSGAAMAPLVAYMTSWSLFGLQRIIAWEAPLMGWHFVVVRVLPEPRLPRPRRLAGQDLLQRVARMAFTDLREFIARLEQQGRLRRIGAPVSRDLEITEIVDRVSKSSGVANVALLFERVDGSDLPVLVNAFGAEDRMAAALGVGRLDELGERVAKLLDARLPGTFGERLRKLGTLIDVARAAPRRVESAPCQEVVETASPSLAGLPILQCWPGDGGRYITLPGVFTRDPVTGARNVGMYRLQVFDDRTLGMHWQIHKGGAEHRAPSPRSAGSRMDVAIALGGDPAMIYAASAPLPPGRRRGGLRRLAARRRRGDGARARTSTSRCRPRPRSCWRAGSIPREQRLEGPFGDHTGYYSLARDYPVFHLTAVTRRARADLSDHDRRAPAPGGLLAGQGHRAHLPADHAADAARDRRHEHAGRGRVPQPRDRLDPQAVSGPRAQGHARRCGAWG